MNAVKVIMVRVYVTEADKLLNAIMDYLHNQVKVRGVTVFRAISGFGKSGAMHSAALLTMSLDLPLVVEFFDIPDKAKSAIEYLNTLVGTGHIVSWDANVY